MHSIIITLNSCGEQPESPSSQKKKIAPCFPVMKKRTLTLLEIVIAMVLMGILLTGLFNVFRQGLKKNIAAKEMKQKVLQLELFQQKMKNLFASESSVYLEKHPEASGLALITSFEEKADPESSMCGTLDGMVYLNDKKQLCFASWSEKGNGRVEVLLDKVDRFQCQLFDAKKGEWMESWPRKKEEIPVMLSLKLEWDKKEIPFVFFLSDPSERITYSVIVNRLPSFLHF